MLGQSLTPRLAPKGQEWCRCVEQVTLVGAATRSSSDIQKSVGYCERAQIELDDPGGADQLEILAGARPKNLIGFPVDDIQNELRFSRVIFSTEPTKL